MNFDSFFLFFFLNFNGRKIEFLCLCSLTLFIKSSSVSKGKLKLKDFIDSTSRCGCKFVHRIPDPSILNNQKTLNNIFYFIYLFYFFQT